MSDSLTSSQVQSACDAGVGAGSTCDGEVEDTASRKSMKSQRESAENSGYNGGDEWSVEASGDSKAGSVSDVVQPTGKQIWYHTEDISDGVEIDPAYSAPGEAEATAEISADSDDLEEQDADEEEPDCDEDDSASSTDDLSGDEYEEIPFNLKRRRVYVV